MNDPYNGIPVHVVQIKIGKDDWMTLHRMIPGRGNVPTLTAALFKKFLNLLHNANIRLDDYAAGNDGILEGLVENLRLEISEMDWTELIEAPLHLMNEAQRRKIIETMKEERVSPAVRSAKIRRASDKLSGKKSKAKTISVSADDLFN